jgi:hypothetical protein
VDYITPNVTVHVTPDLFKTGEITSKTNFKNIILNHRKIIIEKIKFLKRHIKSCRRRVGPIRRCRARRRRRAGSVGWARPPGVYTIDSPGLRPSAPSDPEYARPGSRDQVTEDCHDSTSRGDTARRRRRPCMLSLAFSLRCCSEEIDFCVPAICKNDEVLLTDLLLFIIWRIKSHQELLSWQYVN